MQRFRPGLLALLALLATPAAAGPEAMTEAERLAFRAEIRAYLLENPEVLTEAIEVLNQRQEAASLARDAEMLKANAAAIFSDAASWTGGNPEGDVTVVEFTDYRCGYCRKAHDEVAELVASDGNIRFIIKEFPILGEDSLTSSRFAIAVLQLHGPAPYKAVHDALITLRGTPGPETLAALSRKMNLDPAPILARMDSEEVSAVIAANHALAQTMEISGTPTFVINDTMLRGYVPLEGMRQVVAGARS